MPTRWLKSYEFTGRVRRDTLCDGIQHRPFDYHCSSEYSVLERRVQELEKWLGCCQQHGCGSVCKEVHCNSHQYLKPHHLHLLVCLLHIIRFPRVPFLDIPALKFFRRALEAKQALRQGTTRPDQVSRLNFSIDSRLYNCMITLTVM
jgi:hypothetical protein